MNDEEYQSTMLHFFNLEKYDEEKIMKKISILYANIKDIPLFQEKMRQSAARVMSEDLEMGLVMLFSYDDISEFCRLLKNNKIKLSE